MAAASNNRKPKTLLRNLFSSTTFNCGGCGCGGAKLTDVVDPRRRPTSPPALPFHRIHNSPSDPSTSSSTSNSAGEGIHTFKKEDYEEADPQPSRDPGYDHLAARPRRSNCSSRIGETFAVVKESDDPYLDFRQSMLQIIFEKQICGKHDLEELLACFLRLNSPRYHDVIIRAFAEIWHAIMKLPDAGTMS